MIHEITLSKELIPAEYDYWSYKCIVQNGAHIKKGDLIVSLSFYKDDGSTALLAQNRPLIDRFDLMSEYDGYAFCRHGTSTMNESKWSSKPYNRVFLTVYSSMDDLCSSKYETSYEITTDEFSSENKIIWKSVAGISYREGYKAKSGFGLNGGSISLQFAILGRKPILCLIIKKDTLTVRKRDTISFRFEDNSIRSFPVMETPGKMVAPYSDHYFINLRLNSEDLTSFAGKGWDLLRIEHINGDAPHTFSNSYHINYQPPFSSFLFKIYAEKYIQALGEAGVVLDDYSTTSKRSSAESSPSEKEVCYVYLMKDTSNGYYKIGISNRPEYRERTLQSEKPTIELLTAKPFPSRIIAEAIEQALHKAFGEKRLRGEWFELTPSDVNDIFQALE